MVDCPFCGRSTGVMRLVVGIVHIEQHKCPDCQKVWRNVILIVPFSVGVLVAEIAALNARYLNHKPAHVRRAITFMEAKVKSHSLIGLDKDTALRRRRADNWERRFLQDAIGEDYPDDRRTMTDRRG